MDICGGLAGGEARREAWRRVNGGCDESHASADGSNMVFCCAIGCSGYRLTGGKEADLGRQRYKRRWLNEPEPGKEDGGLGLRPELWRSEEECAVGYRQSCLAKPVRDGVGDRVIREFGLYGSWY